MVRPPVLVLALAAGASLVPGGASMLAAPRQPGKAGYPIVYPGRAAQLGGAFPSDTILRPDLARPPATVRAGLAAAPGHPHLRLGLRDIPIGTGGIFSLRLPLTFPGQNLRERFESMLAPYVSSDSLFADVLRHRVANWGVFRADSVLFLPPAPVPAATPTGADTTPGALPRFVTDYANLAMRVRARTELGGDWNRFRPCDPQFRESCSPTLIPQLSPDMRFGVQVAGTILDRVRVDVDFDQSREFDAANRINIFYEGAEDDILRRLEVGDVTFNLPRSRFLTEGIPAGNFGFQAEGQLGPLDFQTVWAQQRGDLNSREFRLTGIGDQRAFVQEDTLVLDDANYVKGQFFFLIDPHQIDRYPAVNVLDLDAASAPASVEPGSDPIQLYQFDDEPAQRQQVQGFIQADAIADGPGGEIKESGWFRYLQPGVDYFVHPSGLWIVLRTPLRTDQMLAVTYITASGDTVGDYNPERINNFGGRPKLRLLKASGANHQPGMPTWDFEMHQVYRVSGSRDVEPGSVDLTVSLGERSAGRTFKRAPNGDDITFLRLFGLDEESPTDVLDAAAVYTPGDGFFGDQQSVQGTFVIFPTLHPFAEPPPLPSLGLTAEETAGILGGDANHRIYDEVDPFERNNAGLFRLTMSYRIRSQGVISSFSLGALGIREGSERIRLGDRLLVRGVDYEIDYDVGQVRLLEANQLFASNPDAPIRASWEQRALFQVSPTQVFGLHTHAALGSYGGIDVLGLYQSERSVVTRPQLGTEPGAALTGGISGNLSTPMEWLDRFLDAVPGLRFAGNSTLSVNGEMAVSLPNPNTRGTAFIDDFDAAAQLPISLLSSAWDLGSAPASTQGATDILPLALDATDATSLVWQHSWVVETAFGDSVGVQEGYYPREDIDHQIRVAGSEVREPGMLLTFGGLGREQVTRPSWRSVTSPLSTTGLDLTKTDYLEFYAAGGEALTLVVDLGSVSEDAFFVDSVGNTSGTRADTGDRWGLGTLDQEADPSLGQIWSTERDRRGVWVETCMAEPGRIYRQGDPRADCTRGNGRRDSEDLNENGNLDTEERHLRYVVRLDGTSPYLARDTAETHTPFRLYRIPIRGPDAVDVGGTITDADLRAVKDLRLTVTGQRRGQIRLARMRLVGSRWIRRAAEGVLTGIVGDTLAGEGRVEVGTASRVTEGDAYTSPPGVLEQLANPTTAFAGQGIEFNEKSMALTFGDVPGGGRAEVYQRFPQRPRNFLQYRQARLWVVPRSGDFGPDRPHYFFFKAGTDADNFYLYRTRLNPPASPAGVTPGDWLPEVVVDFQEWLDLRERAEEELLLHPPGPGDPPVMVWSQDSTYAVVLKDRGRAPDLAHVRELSVGVWNEGSAPFSGEIWVDELRLGRPLRDAGMATSFEATLDAAGVVTSHLSVTDRGALFRQLRDEPTYQTDRSLNFTSTLRLDRFAPSTWGVEMPVTVSLDRTSQDPVFLSGSDLRANQIRGLRPTNASQTRVGVAFRKRTPAADPLLGLVVNGLDARVAYTKAHGSTITTENESRGLTASVGWERQPAERDFALIPGFAQGAVRSLLPGFLEDPLLGSRVRWTPERLSLGTAYVRQDNRILRFERIIQVPEDSLAIPTLAPRETVETAADVRFRPLSPMVADFTMQTVRDLLKPDEAVSDVRVQDLIRAERARLAGVDLGWETNRSLRTRLGFRPRILSWLRSDLDMTTVYQSDRNANYLLGDRSSPDSVLQLTRNARGQRNWQATLALDPGLLATSWVGPAKPSEPANITQFRNMVGSLKPLTATYQSGLVSRFEREPVTPGTGYQFGWGSTDAFRVMDGDTAATMTDQQTWTLGSGVRLAGGAGFDVGYQRTHGATLDTRSDRTLRQSRWPDVRVALPVLRLPTFTGMKEVTASSGYVRTSRKTLYGGLGPQRRDQVDRAVPVNLSVTWLGAMVTSYQGSWQDGQATDPTGNTEHLQVVHRISMTSRFTPPGSFGKRLDQPVRLNVLGSYTAERDCRSTVAQIECVPFLDQLRRSLNLSLDTTVGGFDVGLQMSYDDRQSYVGQQTGSTQFQIGIFGQLQFSAGVLPTPGG
ncbi:MAG: cell surface protein SprA [Gemmatimonadetes bacterium]|nr:cell surface protein SprA [Gemmatimonadota bacterium]